MAIKKTAHATHAKHVTNDNADNKTLSAPIVADVFDDVQVDVALPPKSRYVVEVDVDVEPKEETNIESIVPMREQILPPPLPPIEEEKEEPLPAPMPPVEPVAPQINEMNVPQSEPELPRFFEEDLKDSYEPTLPPAPIVMPERSQEQIETQQMLEQAVPQAFVADLDEMKEEETGEKRNILVIVLLIAGILCLGGGFIALFLTSRHSSTSSAQPTPVAAVTVTPAPTIEPTPTPVASISAQMKKQYAVNVLNGTTTPGVAGKAASIVRKAGYKIGTVGNGDPKVAGTITVPTGQLSLGNDIASLLTGYTFTVAESATAKDITVVVGAASQ